jgi:hypothetical protein
MIELSMSLLVTSVLVVAIGSSIVLASHAIPDANEAAAKTISAGGALDRLVQELRYAIAINEYTDRAVEFVTADRDGDAVDEVIRYEWSGVAGDPLARTYNAGPAVPVAGDVLAFSLGYALESYQRRSAPVESAEIVLTGRTTGSGRATYALDGSKWMGQYFFPSALPAEAVTWRVNRIQIMASTATVKGSLMYAQLRPVEYGHYPSATVLEQVNVADGDLSSTAGWIDLVFSNVAGLSPDEGLCLVLGWGADSPSVGLEYCGVGADRLVSANGGGVWVVETNSSMLFTVLGAYTVGGTLMTVDILARVDVELHSGGEEPAALHASVNTVNRPEVASP